MTGLLVFGCILLVLLLLLLCPVCVNFRYEESLNIRLRYLFFKKDLMPGTEKPTPKVKKSAKTEKKEASKGQAGSTFSFKSLKDRHGISGLLSLLEDALRLIKTSTVRLLSHLRLKKFDLYLCIGGLEDAAAAAIQYGQLSAAVYSLCGGIFSLMPCKRKGVTVDLDYGTTESRAVATATLSMSPLFVLREVGPLLFGGIPLLWRLIRGGSNHKTISLKKGESK